MLPTLNLTPKLFVVTASLTILLFFSAGAYFQRYSLSCALVPFLSYQQIRDNAFAYTPISTTQQTHLKASIDSALSRIADVYGPAESTPIILVTSDAYSARKWGANETATLHRLPWQTCMIIGPQGQNTDVIAHEWMHAEIQRRVGFARFKKEIPVWFDEGAALTLDYRPPFLPQNISLTRQDIENIKNINSGAVFFSGDTMRNYQAARMAVIPMIDTKSFFENLNRISNGETFEQVFPAL